MVRRSTSLVAALVAGLVTLQGTAAAQVTAGQVDNFENGTTQNWAINLLGMGSPPPATLPTNVPTGGPAGANDNYLRLTAVGTEGPGGRLTSINFMGQWRGNYLAAGIGAIRLDAINLGTTDLSLRLLFENPVAGPPTDVAASSTALFLPAGSGWTSLLFPLVGPGGLTPIAGSLSTLLANTTAIRIYHSPTLTDVGPNVAAQLGVDNITAVATVPEPSTLALLATGALGLLVRRRRQRR
jgi:hypothetical protein